MQHLPRVATPFTPLPCVHIAFLNGLFTSAMTQRGEWASRDIGKGFIGQPRSDTPHQAFFSSRLCARRSSCHWRLCPRAAFSETTLFEDYAAALGHLVSDRMRVWKKHLQGEERFFFSSQRWQANTTEAKITSAIGAVCVGKTSYELWIIPRTSHWNHELGDRAMGESWCTCNVCSRFIIESVCVRITVLRINTRVTMRSTPLFSAKNDV